MALRTRTGVVALAALLLVGAYGHAAGWHERVAEGYHRAKADAADTTVLAAPRREGRPRAARTELTHVDALAAALEHPRAKAASAPEPAGADADEEPEVDDPAPEEAAEGEPPPRAEEPAHPADVPADPAPAKVRATAEPDPPSAPEPEPAPPPPDPAGRLAELVAGFRQEQGLPPLRRSAALDEVAHRWAQVMADEGGLRHNPDVEEQAKAAHGCCRIAENVAHTDPADVDRTHQRLVNSTGHRTNLAGDYQRVGIGIVVDDHNRLWAVQVFHGD